MSHIDITRGTTFPRIATNVVWRATPAVPVLGCKGDDTDDTADWTLGRRTPVAVRLECQPPPDIAQPESPSRYSCRKDFKRLAASRCCRERFRQVVKPGWFHVPLSIMNEQRITGQNAQCFYVCATVEYERFSSAERAVRDSLSGPVLDTI